MRTKRVPATGLGGRCDHLPERSGQVKGVYAPTGNISLPLRVTPDLREAIRKTHPLESAFLEYLLEKDDGRAILVEEGSQ